MMSNRPETIVARPYFKYFSVKMQSYSTNLERQLSPCMYEGARIVVKTSAEILQNSCWGGAARQSGEDSSGWVEDMGLGNHVRSSKERKEEVIWRGLRKYIFEPAATSQLSSLVEIYTGYFPEANKLERLSKQNLNCICAFCFSAYN